MQEHVVFVIEKPSTLRVLAPHLTTRWSSKVYAIATNYIGLYEFRYPRGLRMADFPFVRDPMWKARALPVAPVFEVDQGGARSCGLDPGDLLRRASSIWFAGDPDPSGAVAFHTLLSECLGGELANGSWPALCLYSLDQQGIAQAFDAVGSTTDAWFASARNAGTARRFFDFNYNVNALAVFGPLLRQLCTPNPDYVLSKYSLQLLYALQGLGAVDSDAALMNAMERWRGTGRYAVRGLGSPASRAAIIDGLRSSGLMRGLLISPSGREFLSLLHRDCCDPDLPGRISEWEGTWPESRPRMERYLRTFFGKQKRFAPAAGSPGHRSSEDRSAKERAP
ncbi:DNA topoisomerase IA [Xanthomonas sacchari]|uniref:hypothetical protein n=1 Tax=Xanthomonas sacchari TaxID=56458 RepID=UPI002781E4AD|nr:hypothetical protein [Xanthomonas sacchari]MDQ1090677.1 DNA topoisomerase IA [Xanthomonas sacchari]